MSPSVLVRNFTPTSTGSRSGSVRSGVAVPGQIVQGQEVGAVPTVTVVVAAVPRLALSSTARARRVRAPGAEGVKV